MPTAATSLLCEITAQRAQYAAFVEIAKVCARDVGVRLRFQLSRDPRPASAAAASAEPVLTLHLPAELAASQHPSWCLACFCPGVRVSVLVQAEAAFANARKLARPRRARSA